MIRLALPSDADAMLSIYGPLVRHTPRTFEVETPSRDEMAKRIAGTLENFPRWQRALQAPPVPPREPIPFGKLAR